MIDRFAKVFNVGGNGRQLLVVQELNPDQGVILLNHITVIGGIRVDFQVEFSGEDQEEKAQLYLEQIDQEGAEGIYIRFLEYFECGDDNCLGSQPEKGLTGVTFLSAMDRGNFKRFAKELRAILDKHERQLEQAKNLLNRICLIGRVKEK